MTTKRSVVLFCVLACAAVVAVAAWIVSQRIESPADVAARAAPPTPSPILVPVEKRVLSSSVVTRGMGRFGLPQPLSIVPSGLKVGEGLIATLPLPNTQLEEGNVVLAASGRPLFIFQGKYPVYRDLVPGISGDDVLQLEEGLQRRGFDPGPIDGTYDRQTSDAVAKWYRSNRWDPFGPTPDQLARVRTLEQSWSEANKIKLTTAVAAATAALAVETARVTAEHKNKTAEGDLAARKADQLRFELNPKTGVAKNVETARATAEHNNMAAEAEVEAQIAARALIALDPRQPASALKAADTRLELARAAARRIQLEGETAIEAAERDAKLAPEQLELAEEAVKSVSLEGEMAIRAAVDAQKAADLDAKLAADRADQLVAELEIARSKLGVQVPADEIVFFLSLPVRVKELMKQIGDPARGTVMSVTDNRLAIDSSLTLDAAPLVKPGMEVAIDELALGIKAKGIVRTIANTPGTMGVDGYHIYFEVGVLETSARLEGVSLRLTIPVKSTNGAVTVVPLSALSLAADGTSRIRMDHNGTLEYITVEPGMSADGYVEVKPVDGTSLVPGQLVVVGYGDSQESAPQ